MEPIETELNAAVDDLRWYNDHVVAVDFAGERRVVVRAGFIWWLLAAASLALNVFFVVDIGTHATDTGDRIGVPILGGLLFSVVAAITTSRIETVDSHLVAITTTQTITMGASAIGAVEDDNGLQLVLYDGHHLVLGICQPSVAHALIRNRRRRREAARIREWITVHQDAPSQTLPGHLMVKKLRLGSWLFVPGWTVASVLVAFGLRSL